MNNTTIQKLSEYFEKLPGIGPRQARRFVHFLLNKNVSFLSEFANLLNALKQDIKQCSNCNRFFQHKEAYPVEQSQACNICNNLNRDKKTLLVIEKDIDLENIEKTGTYNGFYFVLGGLIPAIGSEIPKEVKMKKLFEKVKKEISKNELEEIILAFSATQESDNTVRYIEKILEPIFEKRKIKISRLGRGLSTGTELEYSDKETIVNALKNRK
ncbi:MAG: toprim domain-containing protein [Patescibacteria group bacterium]